MLYTLALVLCVLWIVGLVTSYTLGGLIHLLLVVALVVVVVRVFRKPQTLARRPPNRKAFRR